MLTERGRGYTAFIKRVDTGEERAAHYPRRYDSGEEYHWAEGNFSCDCNRELEWLRAGGGNPSLNDVGCSSGRFEVRIVVDP